MRILQSQPCREQGVGGVCAVLGLRPLRTSSLKVSAAAAAGSLSRLGSHFGDKSCREAKGELLDEEGDTPSILPGESVEEPTLLRLPSSRSGEWLQVGGEKQRVRGEVTGLRIKQQDLLDELQLLYWRRWKVKRLQQSKSSSGASRDPFPSALRKGCTVWH